MLKQSERESSLLLRNTSDRLITSLQRGGAAAARRRRQEGSQAAQADGAIFIAHILVRTDRATSDEFP